MNKLELIAALKNEANISKSESAEVVRIFFDSMSDALAQGERVEIRECGLYMPFWVQSLQEWVKF